MVGVKKKKTKKKKENQANQNGKCILCRESLRDVINGSFKKKYIYIYRYRTKKMKEHHVSIRPRINILFDIARKTLYLEIS